MPSPKTILAALLLATLPFAAGCKKKNVQAAPPDVTAPTAENAPAPTTKSEPAATKTEPKKEAAAPPTLVVPPPTPAPAKSSKKKTTTPATPEPVPPATQPEAPRTPPPQMTPRLTPKEQAEAQRNTMADIGTAEKNLNRVADRPLNASQNDMVEKIRGFLGQAREAMGANDWVRARNLAQKARLLSIELVKSL